AGSSRGSGGGRGGAGDEGAAVPGWLGRTGREASASRTGGVDGRRMGRGRRGGGRRRSRPGRRDHPGVAAPGGSTAARVAQDRMSERTSERPVVAKHLYLRKASDELVSHCRCAESEALITSPGQMDCPWCGCGWLFICSRCRKAFTFAEGVEVNESWDETADRTLRTLYQREPESGEAEDWIGFMKILLEGIK